MGAKSKASKGAESGVALKGADVTSQAPKGAMIDVKSMAEYRKQFENYRLQNRLATEAEILQLVKEYIKKRIDGIVDEACRKHIMDLTTVTLSVMTSTVIPFGGVAVVVAATLMQCLNFSVTLGLIPLLNVRSFSDLTTMSSQVGNTIKRASKSSFMAGVETAVLEILENLGVGDWLWTEILRGILIDMIGDSAFDAAWIITPILAAPKYMMHRHLIKKMYRKLGDKAHVVHYTWTEQNCVKAIEVQTTVVSQVQVDAYGNVQGAYLQSQAVSPTQAGASVGAAHVSQTNACFQQQNGGAEQAQVSQTIAYFQQQAPTQHQWPAYPPSSQSPYANPAPGMVRGYPQMPMHPGSNSNPSAKQNATLIIRDTPPANSYFFQPQVQLQGTHIMGNTAPANSSYFLWQAHAGGFFQAAAATQTYTPPPNPTYFQQPYGTRPMYPPQGQP